MNSVNYPEWQRIREEAKLAELKERTEDLGAPRPPLNAAITDHVIRHLLYRIKVLEDAQRAPKTAKA